MAKCANLLFFIVKRTPNSSYMTDLWKMHTYTVDRSMTNFGLQGNVTKYYCCCKLARQMAN